MFNDIIKYKINSNSLKIVIVSFVTFFLLSNNAVFALQDIGTCAKQQALNLSILNNASQNLNCTANDLVSPVLQDVEVVNNDGCAFVGDTATFNLTFGVISSTAPERYDIGIFIPNGSVANTEPETPSAPNALSCPNCCYRQSLTPNPITNSCVSSAATVGTLGPPIIEGSCFPNLDGSFCGDYDQDINPVINIPHVVRLENVVLRCVDNFLSNGNPGSDGIADVKYTVVWKQNSITDPASNRFCTGNNRLIPGTSSKCVTEGVNLETTTVHVTLAHFESSYDRSGVRFDWTTATEEQNIGFNIYGDTGGKKEKLNENIILTKNGDAREPQYYSHILEVPNNIEKVSISSVDSFGVEQYFGPYEIGTTFGEIVEGELVDWEEIKQQHDINMVQMGYEKKGSSWKKQSKDQGLFNRAMKKVKSAFSLGESGICRVEVKEEGIQRVSYEELFSAGCNLNGENIRDIGVSYKGQPVSRYIEDGSIRGKFGVGGYIDFYGELPSGEDAIYINSRLYEIEVNRSLVNKSSNVKQSKGVPDTFSYKKELKQAKQLRYSSSSATGDPFYEYPIIAATSPANYSVNFDVEDNISNEGIVRVVLSGFIQLPGSENDHHVRVHMNEVEIADVEADGFVKIEIESDVENIKPGVNTVRIELPGDTGFQFDAVLVESTELFYKTPLTTDVNKILYTSSGRKHQVDGFTENNIVVYGYDGKQLYKIDGETGNNGSNYKVNFTGSRSESDYWVSTESELLRPSVYKFEEPEDDLLGGSGELLVIAHPSLMGADLNGYLASKKSEGYAVKLANILDVYEEYGHGMALPKAIKDYVTEAQAVLNTHTVVLVGGGSYDHRNFTNSGITDFIPTMYRLTNETIYFSPCDGCLVDTQLGDNVADLALGRFPARTQAELSSMLGKSQIALGENALLVAGEFDGRLDFGKQMDSVSSHLPYNDIKKVYVDDFIANGMTVEDAREQMFAEVNSGVGLWLYSGHAGSLAWRDSLLRWETAQSELTNSAAPAGMMPLTCYTTYYLSPNIMTLAHQLMNNSSGAKFISGAGVLSSFTENEQFTKSILDKMNEGKTIGQSILETKQENKNLSDQVVNWILLGDPTEKF